MKYLFWMLGEWYKINCSQQKSYSLYQLNLQVLFLCIFLLLVWWYILKIFNYCCFYWIIYLNSTFNYSSWIFNNFSCLISIFFCYYLLCCIYQTKSYFYKPTKYTTYHISSSYHSSIANIFSTFIIFIFLNFINSFIFRNLFYNFFAYLLYYI